MQKPSPRPYEELAKLIPETAPFGRGSVSTLCRQRGIAASLHLLCEVYRRNLPHWHPPTAAIFVTWRLAGTFPSLAKTCPDGRRFVQQDKLLDDSVAFTG
jgi:hypothetical protein